MKKVKIAALRAEMDATIERIKVLQVEIDLRERLVKQLLDKYSDLQNQKQAIEDQLLEMEYAALVARDI